LNLQLEIYTVYYSLRQVPITPRSLAVHHWRKKFRTEVELPARRCSKVAGWAVAFYVLEYPL